MKSVRIFLCIRFASLMFTPVALAQSGAVVIKYLDLAAFRLSAEGNIVSLHSADSE